MKAIIPVAGAGTRLRPFTYTQPKALIPVAGKPILGFIIEQLQEIGIKDFVFVIGYLGDKIKDYVEEKHPDINAYYAMQATRKGLGHAISTAKDFVDEGEELLIVLGDTIVETDWKAIIESPNSTLGIKKVEDPTKFGVAEVKPNGSISHVVEKPKFPKSNMAIVGVYKIKETHALFEALATSIKSHTGETEEIHLTDAIDIMVQKGIVFDSFKVSQWYDCGKVDILLETNATLLKKTSYASQDLPFYENTVIIHPVHIAPGTKISNSIIGPNVTIGENSDISYSILKDSIIGNFAKIEQVILHSSVIGSDAVVKGFSQSLNIGDNTEIDLSGQNNPVK